MRLVYVMVFCLVVSVFGCGPSQKEKNEQAEKNEVIQKNENISNGLMEKYNAIYFPPEELEPNFVGLSVESSSSKAFLI